MDQPSSLLTAYCRNIADAQRIRSYPISARINHVANDDEQCCTPANLASPALTYWCERRDSNPHGFTRQILSLVRLPIPPLSHASNYTKWSGVLSKHQTERNSWMDANALA